MKNWQSLKIKVFSSGLFQVLIAFLRVCFILPCKKKFRMHYTLYNTILRIAHWFQWSNSVQQIRFINFWFSNLWLVQIGANIMPHNNSSHFDTFGHDYWEIICLELWQNWVSTPDLTILFSEQFQKKIVIFTGENWWT